MGLFSRNSAVSQQGHATQNEQLIELRQRARRRLIGALVIVLVAVIFVPIFLSSDGADEVEQVVHVFPPIVSPQADNSDLTAANLHSSEKVNDDTLDKVVNEHTNSTNEQELDQHTLHNSLETREESGESTGSTQNLEDADSAQLAESVEQIENLEPADEIKQETSQTKPKEHTQTEPKRTDDGSVALALLE